MALQSFHDVPLPFEVSAEHLGVFESAGIPLNNPVDMWTPASLTDYLQRPLRNNFQLSFSPGMLSDTSAAESSKYLGGQRGYFRRCYVLFPVQVDLLAAELNRQGSWFGDRVAQEESFMLFQVMSRLVDARDSDFTNQVLQRGVERAQRELLDV